MCPRILLRIALVVILIFGVESGDNEIKDVIYEGLEMLEGDDIMKINIELDKIGPTEFVINGTVKHFKIFDDNWKMLFQISHTNNIEQKPYLMHYPSENGEGICEFLKEDYRAFFYETLKDYSNAPHYETCPLEPNEYILTNYPFDANVFQKYLFPGYYEVLLRVQQLEEVVKYKLKFSVE